MTSLDTLWIKNEDWYYLEDREDGKFIYHLKDGAPKEVVTSFNHYQEQLRKKFKRSQELRLSIIKSMEIIEEFDTVYVEKENKSGVVVDIDGFGKYTVEYNDDSLPIGVDGKHILFCCSREEIRLVIKGTDPDLNLDGPPKTVLCPVLKDEIADIDCLENRDNRFPDKVYEEIPDCMEKCKECEWHNF